MEGNVGTVGDSILPVSAGADSILPASMLGSAHGSTSGAVPQVDRLRGNRVGDAAADPYVLAVALPPALVHAVAELVAHGTAQVLTDRVSQDQEPRDGYLNAQGAADYMGVSRKRIHDLTSMRVLVPDGHDGRTPLYTRASLDAYVRSASN